MGTNASDRREHATARNFEEEGALGKKKNFWE